MKCAHDQYRSVQTRYDRGQGTLVYFQRGDCCGAHLDEHERVQFRPYYEAFVAHGDRRELRAERLGIAGTGTRNLV